MITRQAPAWAWDIIDETLAMDAQSRAFDRALRDDIKRALEAMKPCRAAEDNFVLIHDLLEEICSEPITD
jgi:hypothetical protein